MCLIAKSKTSFAAIESNPATRVEVDLAAQEVSLLNEDGSKAASETFEISSYKKTCLLNGYDDIDYLISTKEEIKQYETTHTL